MSRVPAIRHELRHMVMQRNELACYVRDRLQLPPMLKDARVCGRCYAKTPCLIYHKLVDDGNGETSGLKDKFDEAVQHLKPNHQAFFTKWDDLLTKEEREMLKFRRELWTMLSSEREKVGRCFANVIIEAGSAYEEVNAPKINRYRYTLVKAATTPSFSFVESQIGVGEPIVISDEEGHFALANGYVTHVGKSRITVAVDRRLHHARLRRSRFDEGDNQVFAGIMEVKEDNEPPSPLTPQETDTPVLYRLDKDEFSNGMATIRNNLIQLMAHGPFGSREIRSLVVDEKAPVFQAPLLESKVSSHAHLNTDQTRAIEKVMSARNYALVLGMPGTGKTTTISHIICALVAQGKSVLLTSYTHSAVDNILLKMKGERFGILRLGAISKIHPEIQKFAILAAEPKKTMEELQETYQGPQVVATTCLGINHPIFNERIFDYCIVDEASQITLPVCLGPIRMAKTFILVGDHYQLPPLVQNAQAREGGLDVSLFKILSSKHPNSVVNLEHQYRMCAEIMTLSNTLIYSSHLKCGNNAVATQSLSLPNFPRGLHSYHHTPSTLTPSHTTFCPSPTSATCWLHTLLSPSTKACFIDTDALGPLGLEDVAAGSRIVNHAEAKLSSQLVRALLSSGVPGADIGVISVYRSQLALLRHSLRSISSDVEMHTADKFQGRDKDVVILSLVRSNAGHNVGELLRDWRRVNVALTRARSKLLVLGSASTMHGDPLLARFVELMEEKGWLYRLPKEALHDHFFDELVSQGVEEQTGQVLPSPSSSSCSPAAQSAKGPKKPRGPIRGKVNVNKVLGKRGVLRDVLNDVIG
jgi:DNA replication ATP-dependent helicase Dna2